MQYKIDVNYTYGWDDACWIEETRDGITRPLRFETVGSAQAALDGFFAEVEDAVAAGNMDTEKNPNHYRVVAAKCR